MKSHYYRNKRYYDAYEVGRAILGSQSITYWSFLPSAISAAYVTCKPVTKKDPVLVWCSATDCTARFFLHANTIDDLLKYAGKPPYAGIDHLIRKPPYAGKPPIKWINKFEYEIKRYHRNKLIFDGCIRDFFNIPTDLINLCFSFFNTKSIIRLNGSYTAWAEGGDQMEIISEIGYCLSHPLFCVNVPKTLDSNYYLEIVRYISTWWDYQEKSKEIYEYAMTTFIETNGSDCLSYVLFQHDKVFGQSTYNLPFLLNYATQHKAHKCITMLIILLSTDYQNSFPMTRRIPCIPSLIKYHPQDTAFTDFIFNQLTALGIGFSCNGLVADIIAADATQALKRILENKWHEISEAEFAYAQTLGNNCYKLLLSRKKAQQYNYDNDVVYLDSLQWE